MAAASAVDDPSGELTARGQAPMERWTWQAAYWEWTADWYDETYYSSTSAQNPKGPDSGQSRVVRGGSFESTHMVRPSGCPRPVRPSTKTRTTTSVSAAHAPIDGGSGIKLGTGEHNTDTRRARGVRATERWDR